MYTEQRTFVRTLCRNYKTSGIVATFESLDLSWRDVMVWIQIPRNGLESGDTGRGERGEGTKENGSYFEWVWLADYRFWADVDDGILMDHDVMESERSKSL